MEAGKKLKKVLASGKTVSLVSLRKLGNVTSTVGSYLRPQPRLQFKVPKARIGKVSYFVKVDSAVAMPTLMFTRKRDAEQFKRLLEEASTVMGFAIKADILRQEITQEGYHL